MVRIRKLPNLTIIWDSGDSATYTPFMPILVSMKGVGAILQKRGFMPKHSVL